MSPTFLVCFIVLAAYFVPEPLPLPAAAWRLDLVVPPLAEELPLFVVPFAAAELEFPLAVPELFCCELLLFSDAVPLLSVVVPLSVFC